MADSSCSSDRSGQKRTRTPSVRAYGYDQKELADAAARKAADKAVASTAAKAPGKSPVQQKAAGADDSRPPVSSSGSPEAKAVNGAARPADAHHRPAGAATANGTARAAGAGCKAAAADSTDRAAQQVPQQPTQPAAAPAAAAGAAAEPAASAVQHPPRQPAAYAPALPAWANLAAAPPPVPARPPGGTRSVWAFPEPVRRARSSLRVQEVPVHVGFRIADLVAPFRRATLHGAGGRGQDGGASDDSSSTDEGPAILQTNARAEPVKPRPVYRKVGDKKC